MLRPARMYSVDCIVHEGRRERVVSRLHSSGVAQIESVADDFVQGNSLVRLPPADGVFRVSKMMSSSRGLIGILSNYSTSVPGFIDSTLDVDRTPRTPVKPMDFQELSEYSESFLRQALSEVKACEAGLNSLRSKGKQLGEKIRRYAPLSKLPYPLEYFGLSSGLYTVVGALPVDGEGVFQERLRGAFFGFCFTMKFDEADDSSFFVVSVPSERREDLSGVLAFARFRVVEVEGSGTVAELLRTSSEELESVEKSIALEEAAMRSLYDKHYSMALVIMELLEIQKQKFEVASAFVSTGKTVLIRLWVPEKKFHALESIITEECEGLFTLEVDCDPRDAPVLLDNPGIVKPFEMFTRMFSTPVYNQIDPTILVAPAFTLFFGIMFADFAYGLMLMSLAYLLYKNYGPYSGTLKDFSLVLACFSFSSMFFGILSGGFLGDFLGKYVLGDERGSQAVALWLDPLYNGNIKTYIMLVFAIGFAHVLVGYLSGAFDAVRRGEYKRAFMDYVTMIVAPIGVVVYALNGSVVALSLSVLSLILVFVGSGLMGFYLKVSGIVGNVVSYARLVALMTSGGGIAMTVNFMASLVMSIPYVGIVLGPIVFILGHVINLGLNVLGSFVHGLRLQYVEFFGTFYEGGGVEFTPFVEARKYSKLIREEVR